MRHLTLNDALSSDGSEGDFSSPSPPNRPPRPALSHRQAWGQLVLVLDDDADPELVAAIEAHAAGCSRCRTELAQLRQAECWFQQQPRTAPALADAQSLVWARIQAELAGIEQPMLASSANLSEPAENDEPAYASLLPASIPLASDAPELPPPAPTPAPLTQPARTGAWLVKPRNLLVAVLAASFLMTSLAALVLAHLSNTAGKAPLSSASLPPLADVLDPGAITPAYSFDPLSRQVFTLTSDRRFDCPRNEHCPAVPPCLHLSMWDADSGKAQGAVLPACAKSQSGRDGSSFTALLADTNAGKMLVMDTQRTVMAFSSRSSTPAATYQLACCDDAESWAGKTLLDQRDHLLLSATVSGDWALESLVAQDASSGQVKYRSPLDGERFGSALFSEETGWLYLWTTCSAAASGACTEVYEASSGQKLATWEMLADETPLAADPTQPVLYVRHDLADGQSETLALDAQSGVSLGTLPAAQALAVNPTLHHAYLVSEAGVTVVDTLTRAALSTLPVLAHDTNWAPPVVDEQTDRVYLPTARGKLLRVQDDASGHLRLGSAALEAVLDADRVMENEWTTGADVLDPWNLPVGPGTLSLNYVVEQSLQDGCQAALAPARLDTLANAQKDGAYTVMISLAWSNPSATRDAAPMITPSLQRSYPHEHTWLYRVPAGGGASPTSEQGEALPANC